MDDRAYAGVIRQTMEELTNQFAHPTEIGITFAGRDGELRRVGSRCGVRRRTTDFPTV